MASCGCARVWFERQRLIYEERVCEGEVRGVVEKYH